jgi:hypothetical protein
MWSYCHKVNGQQVCDFEKGPFAFPAGIWYWRLCTKRFSGPVDTCILEGEIRQINLLAVQTNPGTKKQATTPTLPTLSVRQAKGAINKALKKRLGRSFTKGRSEARTCYRKSKTLLSCFYSWHFKKFYFQGDQIDVRRSSTGVRPKGTVRRYLTACWNNPYVGGDYRNPLRRECRHIKRYRLG